MRYRKRPVEIETVLWTGTDAAAVQALSPDVKVDYGNGLLIIPTLEGDMTATKGDWIIRGVQGELYPCKPDIFKQTYEPA
jgi:hypothetical protein